MNDLKFALCQLLKNPGFTAVATLSLSVEIGATTSTNIGLLSAPVEASPALRPVRFLNLYAEAKNDRWKGGQTDSTKLQRAKSNQRQPFPIAFQ